MTKAEREWRVFTHDREAVVEAVKEGAAMAFFRLQEGLSMGLPSSCFVQPSWMTSRPSRTGEHAAASRSSSATRWCIVLCSD